MRCCLKRMFVKSLDNILLLCYNKAGDIKMISCHENFFHNILDKRIEMCYTVYAEYEQY